ncbi:MULTISPECIES: hypothetical protein [unclassified Sinorhizobium]|uniref:hypothetical protein n=1 Tax=unclassified Sinorhizobium TaxID=2613772 RepID=UPI0035258BAA
MTTIHYISTGKGPASLVPTQSSSTHVFDFARKLARRWHRWQTQREIESMPFEIRKDIGWPTAYEDEARRTMQ